MIQSKKSLPNFQKAGYWVNGALAARSSWKEYQKVIFLDFVLAHIPDKSQKLSPK